MAARKTPSGGSKTDKPWRDALMLAVKDATDDADRNKLRKIAKKLVEEALGGNVNAIKEIGDRLDGKAAQAIQADVTGNLTVNVVARGKH